MTALGKHGRVDNKSADSRSSKICHDVRSSRGYSSLLLAPLDRFAAKHDSSRPPLEYTIDKLNRLISDPAAVTTSDSKPWIDRLLGNFLRDVGDDGYKVEHLTVVTRVLEFLATRAKDDEEYQIHLARMLELCKLPPLLQKMSDCPRCEDILVRYFSALGQLAITLSPMDKEILKVLEALRSLLVGSKLSLAGSVKLRLCHDAASKSRLAVVLTTLSEICSPEIYHRALELVAILTTISDDCCYVMLEAGILDHLFTRMSKRRGLQVFDDISPEDEEPSEEDVVPTATVVLSLMRSILSRRKLDPKIEKLPSPSIGAMRSLRNVFRYRVRHSHGHTESLISRNDLALVILAGLAALPRWHLVRCGLADDIVVLSIADGTGIEGTWTENITFDASNENLIFKRIILAILDHLSSRSAAIAIMAKRGVTNAILEMINPRNDRPTRWSMTQFWYLSRFAMRTLARLAPKMPEEFVRNEGSARLSTLVEWSLTVDFDTDIAMEFTRTICGIVHSKCPVILMDFRREGIELTLVELVNRILTLGCLTMRHQRILTLLLTTIEEMIKMEENISRGTRKEPSLDIVTKLLHRCLYRRKEDFPLDQRLLVAIGSYLWECVVDCPETMEKFVENGGIYTILDIIDESCFPVRCVYLGILTDISSNRCGAPHLCTWRGTDRTKGFVSLLAKCWREEEIRTGVKRTTDGCIDDVELPMMGTEQWINAFHARATHDFSPALASILGSVRPKIYSLRKIMINETDRYEKSRERYKILFNDPPVEDRITMYIADHFYRFAQGQLWSEISRYLEQIGVNTLGMDGETMLLMNQRHRDWGMYARGLQDKLLRAEKKRETERERDEITRIRDSRLGTAMSALREIDYIRRTTERDYTIERKKIQRDRVDEALRFPDLSDRRHRHRTFRHKWNFTTILEHDHAIPMSVPTGSAEITSLPSVSTAISSFEKIKPTWKKKFKDSVGVEETFADAHLTEPIMN